MTRTLTAVLTTTAATPAEMRDFIEQYVGPMVLRVNGEIERQVSQTALETPTAPEPEAVKRSKGFSQRRPAGPIARSDIIVPRKSKSFARVLTGDVYVLEHAH